MSDISTEERFFQCYEQALDSEERRHKARDGIMELMRLHGKDIIDEADRPLVGVALTGTSIMTLRPRPDEIEGARRAREWFPDEDEEFLSHQDDRVTDLLVSNAEARRQLQELEQAANAEFMGRKVELTSPGGCLIWQQNGAHHKIGKESARGNISGLSLRDADWSDNMPRQLTIQHKRLVLPDQTRFANLVTRDIDHPGAFLRLVEVKFL